MTDKEINEMIDRAVGKVNSMTREEREEFHESIPDPLRKLFEDAYVPIKPKEK